MRRILLPVLLITFALTYALTTASNAYELSDPDAQAMTRLIKGDINSITIVGKETWDVERFLSPSLKPYQVSNKYLRLLLRRHVMNSSYEPNKVRKSNIGYQLRLTAILVMFLQNL